MSCKCNGSSEAETEPSDTVFVFTSEMVYIYQSESTDNIEKVAIQIRHRESNGIKQRRVIVDAFGSVGSCGQTGGVVTSDGSGGLLEVLQVQLHVVQLPLRGGADGDVHVVHAVPKKPL